MSDPFTGPSQSLNSDNSDKSSRKRSSEDEAEGRPSPKRQRQNQSPGLSAKTAGLNFNDNQNATEEQIHFLKEWFTEAMANDMQMDGKLVRRLPGDQRRSADQAYIKETRNQQDKKVIRSLSTKLDISKADLAASKKEVARLTELLEQREKTITEISKHGQHQEDREAYANIGEHEEMLDALQQVIDNQGRTFEDLQKRIQDGDILDDHKAKFSRYNHKIKDLMGEVDSLERVINDSETCKKELKRRNDGNFRPREEYLEGLKERKKGKKGEEK